MVSVPRQAWISGIGRVFFRPSDSSGSGGGHARPRLSDGDADVLPVRVHGDHGDHLGRIGLGPHEFHGLDDLLPDLDDAGLHRGAFSLWGGGWLATLGVADFSGGYVIHLAAGASGFTAAWVLGPRLQADRDHFPPNSLLVTLVSAGILWIGWNGFNGGDPYFANANAGAAVLNTNTATAVGLLVWTLMDKMAYGKPSVLGAVNGMIAGLVGITPCAGYVDGWGAIIVGVCAGIIPWLSMNKFQAWLHAKGRRYAWRVLDPRRGWTDGRSADGRAGQPGDAGVDRHRQGRARLSITGLMYGNANQLLLQAEALPSSSCTT